MLRHGVAALRRCDLAGAVCFISGTVGYVYVSQQGVLNEAVTVCLGVLVGAGGLLVHLSWGRAFARLGLKDALFNVVLSMGLASALSWLLVRMDEVGFSLLFSCLATLGALLSLVQNDRRVAGGSCVDTAGSFVDPHLREWSFGTVVRSIRETMGIMAAPFLGLLVFGFASFLIDMDSIARLYDAQILGYLMGLALLVLLLFVRFRHPPYPFFYQVFLPFLAVCALVARMLVGEGLANGVVFDVSLHIVFGVVVAFSFASLAAIGHAGELPIEIIAALAYGLYCFASLAGTAVSAIGENLGLRPSDFALFAWVLYFAFQVLYPAVLNWTGAYAAETDGTGAFSIAENLVARCEELAADRGLTPRETEICAYLGRGHSSLYISRTLLIADSTVRTHIKNIYRKLNVSSREELLDLIDAFRAK